MSALKQATAHFGYSTGTFYGGVFEPQHGAVLNLLDTWSWDECTQQVMKQMHSKLRNVFSVAASGYCMKF